MQKFSPTLDFHTENLYTQHIQPQQEKKVTMADFASWYYCQLS